MNTNVGCTDNDQHPEIDNRGIFAKNLNFYIERSGVTRKDICHAIDVNYSTFSEWCGGSKYPRIDSIQVLADYFSIWKSDLIEENYNPAHQYGVYNDQDISVQREIHDIILRLQRDVEFLTVVEMISKYDSEKIASIKHLLDAFSV